MCMIKSEAYYIINKIMEKKFEIKDINESVKKLEADYNCSVDDFTHIYSRLFKFLHYDFYEKELKFIIYERIEIYEDIISAYSSVSLEIYHKDRKITLYDSYYPEIILGIVTGKFRLEINKLDNEKFYKNMSRKQFLEVVSLINEYFLRNIEQFSLIGI